MEIVRGDQELQLPSLNSAVEWSFEPGAIERMAAMPPITVS